MKKLWIWIFLFVVLAAGIGLYYWRVSSIKKNVTEGVIDSSPTPAAGELLEWKDQAGFSFSYPKGLVSDIHEEDTQNYAHIDFTHPDYSGKITIWAKDTSAVDTVAWVKKEPSYASGTVFETTFADMDGKKVLLSIPKKKVITGVVEDAIAFFVEGELEDSPYWTSAYETIVATFAFTPLESEAPSSEVSDEVVVDEEEVLE